MPLAGRMLRFVMGSRRIGAARPASPGRAAVFAAAAISLGFLMLPCGRADAESNGVAADPTVVASDLTVTVAGGRLSVRVGEAPLEAVLEAIAAQADVRITLRGDPGMVGPQAFADLPLPEPASGASRATASC